MHPQRDRVGARRDVDATRDHEPLAAELDAITPGLQPLEPERSAFGGHFPAQVVALDDHARARVFETRDVTDEPRVVDENVIDVGGSGSGFGNRLHGHVPREPTARTKLTYPTRERVVLW